jgi:glycosyltransferase involved in cell wall biosynthesis
LDDKTEHPKKQIMNLPLVTIVTSSYNHQRYLRRAIDSVLSQDYPNIEYLVFNDGSPDNTEEILKSYGNKFYWETQPNMGETPTLNKAINLAKGELVGKLSSDDYLYPGAIKAMVDLFLEQPELVVVYSDFDLVDENDEIFQSIQKPDYSYVETIRQHLCLPGPCALFRTEIFRKLGGFDTSFRILFDMDFWWRAGLLGEFARLPKSLTAFRQHRNSQSSSGGERMASETIACVNKFYSSHNLPNNILKVKKDAFSNAYYSAAMQAAQARKFQKTKDYLWKSCFFSPFNYLKKENRTKLINFINIMMPPKVLSFTKRIYRFLRN